MAFSACRLLELLLVYILVLVVPLVAQSPFQLKQYYSCLDDAGYYNDGSKYKTNLDSVSDKINSLTEIDYGFFNFSYGEEPDRVDAVGLCRGDLKQHDCLDCLAEGEAALAEFCPNQKAAIMNYFNCVLRYSPANSSVFGNSDDENGPLIYVSSLLNLTSNVSQSESDRVLGELLDSLRRQAASGGSLKKYAANNTTGPDSPTIYADVQCTPDLSEEQCNNCLTYIFSKIPMCCEGRQGGRVIAASCNFRFESGPFYDSSADLQTTSPSISPVHKNTTSRKGKKTLALPSKIVIITVVPIAALATFLVLTCMYLRSKSRRKLKDNEKRYEASDEIETADSSQYDFETIREATDNFSDSSKLGKGGFGVVYKGVLQDGQQIAVKRLSRRSERGDKEFKNEVELVARLHHRNLVKLKGFSMEGNERLLIYEFIPNKSLDHFIFDPTMREQLDWERRFKIIEGTARGLSYLHDDCRPKIIHRDLKAGNILLDANMNAKIADFGTARMFEVDQIQAGTQKIVGSYGYMAPEYANLGLFSGKSDVFSFGVLVLEIITGRKSSKFQVDENFEHLLSYTWRHWMEGTISNIIDPALQAGSGDEIKRCIHIGLLCVQENPKNRPTMTAVVLMLNSSSLPLPVPSNPAFLINTSGPESTKASANTASISEMYPR